MTKKNGEDQITDWADYGIQPRELATKAHTVVSTATTNFISGECKVGYSGEENEGGLFVEDLEGG